MSTNPLLCTYQWRCLRLNSESVHPHKPEGILYRRTTLGQVRGITRGSSLALGASRNDLFPAFASDWVAVQGIFREAIPVNAFRNFFGRTQPALMSQQLPTTQICCLLGCSSANCRAGGIPSAESDPPLAGNWSCAYQ